MTIVEFLRARYAEAAEWFAGGMCDCPPVHADPSCPVRLERQVRAFNAVVRQCEATRGALRARDADDADFLAWQILARLAVAFDWHPDYDEEWAP